MKLLNKHFTFALTLIGLLAPNAPAANWTAGMTEGKPEFKSMGPLAFGPEGILFIGDTKAAAITAVATGDTTSAPSAQPLKVEGINQKIAGLLGTSANEIQINDMVVNSTSRTVYLAVARGRGPDAVPVLMRVQANGQLEEVSLDKVPFSRAELTNAFEEREGRRNPRLDSITDIAFYEDRVLMAGLSNEEFASTFRYIPFPFKAVPNGAGVEFYHGAHGKWEGRLETPSPVRTFVPFKVGDQPQLLAAYTCTPLVQVPLKDLVPGAKLQGKTIAELGNRNRPIDMIVYQKGGKDYLLLANSSRGVMKIRTDGIGDADSITSRVSGTQGVPYETISSWTGVEQLDSLDAMHALVMRRADGGSLDLESLPLP